MANQRQIAFESSVEMLLKIAEEASAKDLPQSTVRSRHLAVRAVQVAAQISDKKSLDKRRHAEPSSFYFKVKL